MSDFRISGVIDAHSRGYQLALAQALGTTKAFAGEQRKAAMSSRALESQTRQLNRALQQQSRQLAILTLQFTAFRNAVRTLALRTAITGFAAMTSAVAALAGGMAMLAQQAGVLGVALGTVGAAGLGGIVQGAVVASLALKGVGKALTTTGKDHEKAMAKLTKPARAFVHEIAGMRDGFREIKLLAQQGLFTGLASAAHRLKPALEPLKQVVFDTASALGYLGDRAAFVISGRLKDLKAIGERNVITLRRMGDGAINLGRAFIDVFRAADPFIGHVTRGLLTLTRNLADAAHKARANGSLGHFFFELQQTWDTWTSTFGHVGSTLLNIFKAAAGPAGVMADAIHKTTGKWKEWTGDRAGQAFLTRFFEANNRVLGSMARLLGDVGKMFAELSITGAPNAERFFDGIRVHVLPVLKELAIQLNAGVFPRLMELGGAFADLVHAALPGLRPLGEAIGFFVGQITAFLHAVTPLVDQAPGVSKLILAFAIGVGIIEGWTKLRQAIELTILRARQAMGMAPRIAAGGGAAAGGVTPAVAAGGRGTQGFLQPAPRPGSFRLPTRGIAAGERDRGVSAAQGLLAWNREAERAARAGEKLGRVARTYGGPINALTGLGNGIGIVHSPSGDRSASTGRFVPSEGRRGVLAGTTAARPSTARAQLDAQHFDLTQRSSAKRIAENIGGGINAGVTTGMRKAAPIVKGGFAIAATSGIITGLSSDAKGFGNRLRDVLSGATFGAFKSSNERLQTNAAKAARQIQGGTFNPNIGGAKVQGGPVKLNLIRPEDRTSAKQFIEYLKAFGKISEESKVKLVAMVDAFGDRVDQVGPQAAKLKGAISSGLDLGGAIARTEDGVDRIKAAFTDMQRSGGLSARKLKEHVATNSSIMAAELGRNTQSGRLALAKNFRLAAASVRTSMREGAISTQEGTKLIRHYLIEALHELGIKKNAARYLKDRDPLTNKPIGPAKGAAPGTDTGKARGGMFSLPGSVGPDSIPMQVNGQSIMAAPGEDVAIINRHQRKFLDRRLADVGGLPGVFKAISKPHNYASGGLVDTAGMPSNSGSVVPLGRWLQAHGFAVGENPAFGGVAPVHAHYGAADHYHGGAIDVNADGRPGGEKRWIDAIANPIRSHGFHVLWQVKDHFDHLHTDIGSAAASAIGLGGGSGAASSVIPTLGTAISGMTGLVGGLADESLARVSAAAQDRLKQIADQAGLGESERGVGTGRIPAGGGNVSANRELAKQMAAMRGWTGASWVALDHLIMGESGYKTQATNSSSGAYGIGQFLGKTKAAYASRGATSPEPGRQINAMLEYIKDRYGGPQAAYSAWLARSPHWYGSGGIVQAVAGFLDQYGGPQPPPRNGGTPPVDTNDAVTPGSQGDRDARGKKKPDAKDKKKAKPKPKSKSKKPYTGGPKLPGAADRKTKTKKPARKPQVPKALRGRFTLPDDQDVDAEILAIVGNLDKQWEDPLARMLTSIDTLGGRFDLTNEEATVNLYDSIDSADLSAFMGQHPEMLRYLQGAKPSETSLEVLNPDGMTVQGQFTRGISHHVGEVRQLLAQHAGSPDGTENGGGVMGHLQRYVADLTGKRPKLQHEVTKAKNRLHQMHVIFNHNLRKRRHALKELGRLRRKGGSWQSRVAANSDQIDEYEDFLDKSKDATVGHRPTEEMQHNINTARRRMRELREENVSLRKHKPAPKSLGKHGAKMIADARFEAQQGRVEMDFLAGNHVGWNEKGGEATKWAARRDGFTTAIASLVDKRDEVKDARIPQERLVIANLVGEIGDWLGRRVPPPQVQAPTGDDTTAQTEQRNALIEQQRDEALRSLALTNAQFATIKEFRFQGAFAHGGVVDQAGMALVHANERLTVDADPEGAFGTRARGALSRQGGGGGGHIILGLDESRLLTIIRAEIDGRAPEVTDRRLGRDGRSRRIAPGR